MSLELIICIGYLVIMLLTYIIIMSGSDFDDDDMGIAMFISISWIFLLIGGIVFSPFLLINYIIKKIKLK